MQPQDRTFYEDSLKDYRDLKSAIDTSFKEGKVEGKEERNMEIAKSALRKGCLLHLFKSLQG